MNFEGRMLQGQILMGKGDAKAAVENFEKLDKAYTGVPIVKFHLARLICWRGIPRRRPRFFRRRCLQTGFCGGGAASG